ncbi:MAG: hypothetical protein CVT60_06965 [Actinobacteria bacterium HGW-Actinobacteria-10]|nr:MAG: hypothetical protein CVT60_06965 [Actinobacteria bacterium HGW-Actinobacteria-10]
MGLRRLLGLDDQPDTETRERASSQSDLTGLLVTKPGGVGVLFARWEVIDLFGDQGAYSKRAFGVIFNRLLYPHRMAGCTVVCGETLSEPGGSEHYMVAFLEADGSQIAYVREALSSAHGQGLLPHKERYLAGSRPPTTQ